MHVAYGRAGESVTAWEPQETHTNVRRSEQHAEAFVMIRLRVPANTTDAELVAMVDNEAGRIPTLIREAVADCRRDLEPPASPWTG